MAKKAAVFEKTYKDYLARIAGIDFLSRADVLGAQISGNALIIPFYGTPYRVSVDGVVDAAGEQANFAVSVVLCQYILHCPDNVAADGSWVTYREFKDAAPLIGYFTTNANKVIESTFAGDMARLEKACKRLGGVSFDDGSAFDISIRFDFIPRIPVLLRFNDQDDEFPAQCSILFRQSAERYLDMECLAIGGTYLAGILTKFPFLSRIEHPVSAIVSQ
jgi:hypothetical protein